MVDPFAKNQRRLSDLSAMRIKIASPEVIRSWSFGEVTKPETINYRSFKPEKDGLFCERIFGPVKDWECNCGKYKRIRFRGIVCDRCGVEVTQSKVRRERMGHIDLAVPVTHIWYTHSLPSRIGYLLDLTVRELERIIYYQSYIVIDPGNTSLKKMDIISEDEYYELEESGKELVARMGAEAIRELLRQTDIEELAVSLRAQVKVETSVQRKKDTLKRLRVIEAFRQSQNKPEWMVLEVIPVIPPDLRPLVPLEGGRFATSDLNDLYRRVINRNNRLKKLIEIKAPEVILRNEKRMLQEAVDALFDNGRRSRSVRGDSKRPLKSLSDLLKGKQGRFRQNLLGKRVDYSGRSVIVVGPELKLNQCGLPKNMALELFKPFIIHKLEEKGYVQTVKSAKRLVERERPEVWDILEEIIRDHPVLLNRAPTLHLLGIQAFYPVLVEGKAIRLHPLVCAAFNADFDGDQMAVHVPLSFESQLEARLLMLSTHNLLQPSSGKPVAIPSQDMVIGCYYLTKDRVGVKGEEMIFGSQSEVIFAYSSGIIDLHAWVAIPGKSRKLSEYSGKQREKYYEDYSGIVPDSMKKLKGFLKQRQELLEKKIKDSKNRKGKDEDSFQEFFATTVGRVIFNEIIPAGQDYFNKVAVKSAIEKVVSDVHRISGNEPTATFLDDLKNIGFEYATIGGVTVGIDDIVVPQEKEGMLKNAEKEVEKIHRQYEKGAITNGERYNKVIDTWTRTTSDVAEILFKRLKDVDQGFNPIFMMTDSGARGSRDQVRQLAGMRGLMAKPQKRMTGQIGEIIESPITANFREGLTVLEYFISTHGARKGLADTALKTADAGYLTRRLVDVAQDVIINEDDCGTILGIEVSALKEGEEIIESLHDRVLGRVALMDVYDPITQEVIAEAGTEIGEEASTLIDESGIETVSIRSVLTCESRRGVCAKCYGRNLSTGRMVNLGEAVGVIAAQSIGEPGTQLTLRTFHIGGTAAVITEQSKITAKSAGKIAFSGVKMVPGENPEDHIVLTREGEIRIVDDQERIRQRYATPYGCTLKVRDGQQVEKDDVLFEWDPHTNMILTDKTGTIEYVDVIENVTYREELDESTGLSARVIIEQREKTLRPHIAIIDSKGKRLANYSIPTGAHLVVKDGDAIKAGQMLVKIPREIYKTKDITGGLPRVAELFEARHPKDPAVVTEIDGTIEYGKVVRGNQQMIVHGEHGEDKEYLIPHGKHMLVHESDAVKAGSRLSEGPIDPHDILRIKGPNSVQEYLVNEIQGVYRLQGVKINDKHIEVIIRQVLQKVRILDPGDSNFLEGEQVDKIRFQDERDRVLQDGGNPATYEPLLLGITKASLSTESFLSAASFQETTRVLTEASIQGKVDLLLGLKENVIIGRLIPAGTGIPYYNSVELVNEQETTEPEKKIEAIG